MKMIIFLLLVALTFVSGAQPNIVWARQTGNSGADAGGLISTDAYGNSYVSGSISGIVSFGNKTLNASNGGQFLAKYDSAGVLKWVQQMKNITVSAIKAKTRFAYLCGRYLDTASIGTTSLVSTGGNDGFIMQIDNAGNTSLILHSAGLGWEAVNSVDVDKWGNIYCTGYFDTLSIFGVDTLRGTARVNYFMIKYDSLGKIVWKSTGTQKKSNTIGEVITVQENGNSLYVSGVAEGNGSPAFDSVDFSNSNIYFQGYSNFHFVAAYNSGGNLIKIKTFNGGNHWNMTDIDTDTLGNLYESDCHYYLGFWVRKFAPSFNLLWERYVPFSAHSTFFDIETDISGDVYVTGSFDKKVGFPGDTLRNHGTSKNSLTSTLYVAKFDRKGLYKWSVKAGTNSQNVSHHISSDSKGSAYITGFFRDSLYLGTFNFMAAGSSDVFLAKINGSDSFVGIHGATYDSENKWLTVFPNPNDGKFQLTGDEEFQNMNFKILNAVGQIILEKMNVSYSNLSFDISSYSSGIYFIEAWRSGMFQRARVVKD